MMTNPTRKSGLVPLYLRLAMRFSLWVTGGVFIVLWSLIAWNARLADDDFSALSLLRTRGFFGSMWSWYTGWNGRWSSVLLSNVCFLFKGETFAAVYCSFGALAGLVIGLAWLYRETIRKYGLHSPSWRCGESWLAAIFVSALLYFVTPNTGESWFWVAGAGCYGWTIVWGILGTASFWASHRKHSWLVFSAIFLALSAGGSEPSALLLFGWLSILVSITAFHKRSRILQDNHSRSIIYVWLAVTASFAILVLAPGNAIRAQAVGHNGELFKAFSTAISVAWNTTCLIFHFNKIWLSCAAVAGFIAGVTLFGKKPGWTWRRLIFTFALLLLASGIAQYLLAFPAAYAYGGPAADRSIVMTAFVILLSMIAFGVIVSRTAPKLPSVAWIGIWLVSLGFVWLMTGYEVQQIQRKQAAVRRFSAAYDARIEQLLAEKLKGRTEVMLLDPLPWAKEYHSHSIGTDVSDGFNKGFQDALGLPFGIRRK